MTAKKRFGIDLDPELVRQIDERRGDEPRQVWVAQAIAEKLGGYVLAPTGLRRGRPKLKGVKAPESRSDRFRKATQ